MAFHHLPFTLETMPRHRFITDLNSRLEEWKVLLPKRREEDVQRAINTLVDWFSETWLDEPGGTSLQQLWQDDVPLSAIELFGIAHALWRIETLLSTPVRKDLQRKLKATPDESDGATFEVLLGAYLQAGGEEVTFPPANQPGFDLQVSRGQKTVRVSCKHLQASAHQKKFSDFVCHLEGIYRAMLRPEERLSILVGNQGYREEDMNHQLTRHFTGVLMQHRRKPDQHGLWMIPGSQWWVRFGRLTEPPQGQEFHPAFPSYSFLAMCERNLKEQQRVISKLEEAIRKYRKHGQLQDDHHINLIALRVPSDVSLEAIKGYLDGYWTPEHDHISGVLLLRTQVTHQWVAGTQNLTCEGIYLANPHSSIDSDLFMEGRPINVHHLSAQMVQEETKIQVTQGERVVEVPAGYMYSSGELHLKFKETTLQLSRLPNTRIKMVNLVRGHYIFHEIPFTSSRNQLLLL